MQFASWFIALLAVAASGSQIPCPSKIPPQTTAGTRFTGVPYSARETTVKTQRLSDGTKITQTFVTLLWRDSEGRTRRELIRHSPSGAESHSIIVTDPVEGDYLKWEMGSGTARRVVALWLMPPAQKITAPPPPGPLFHVRPATAATRPGVQMEILAPQNINGVYCEGSRAVRTIQLEEENSSRAIHVTSEIWISPDLRIIVHHTTDDLRSGQVATDVTDVVRGDPDPGLFQVPEGYELVIHRQPGAQ